MNVELVRIDDIEIALEITTNTLIISRWFRRSIKEYIDDLIHESLHAALATVLSMHERVELLLSGVEEEIVHKLQM